MSRKEKLEQRIRNNPINVSLEDFEALIRVYGFIKEHGNHPKARIGNQTMPYKRKNPLNPSYVKDLLQMIDSLQRR